MPCRVDDYTTRYVSETRHGMTIADFEAVLCGLFTEMEADGELFLWLGDIDWAEVGVSRKMVEAWWEAHNREDEFRRAKEAAEKIKEQKRKAALAKLTAEDRKALGL